ncbi:MAG TPA: amidase, partial [Gammaproteobacteria bacterium]|nr:amidase [Gammaproteobacteria bacterium]
MSDFADLTALAARELLASGALSAVDLTRACLQRIAAREPVVQAWNCIDEDLALTRAGTLDRYRQTGGALGPLHGLPVGIKDIMDTGDLPTENGTRMDAGRRPADDAWLVARLRAAGAVIPGKTVTTECAYLAPAKTHNPHNPEHTPGGSSSGSAAAVACGMVPFAVGTQTGGSVIRPASYCGVVGFKPTFGLIPRTGVLRTSRHLDTVGTFARTIEDAALLADALAGQDPADPDTVPILIERPYASEGRWIVYSVGESVVVETDRERVLALIAAPWSVAESAGASPELIDEMKARIYVTDWQGMRWGGGGKRRE